MANSSSISPSLPSWAAEWTQASIRSISNSKTATGTAWHILGAGAIGQLLATKLVESGIQVVLVTRARPNPIRGSLRIQRVGLNAIKTFTVTCEPANLAGPIQHLLVTTKSNQVLQALVDVRPRLQQTSKIILLHNGMGTLESAQQYFDENQIFCGVTTEGAYLQTKTSLGKTQQHHTQLVYAGQGTTEIGQPAQPIAPAWIQTLLDSNAGFTWQSNIETVLWRKLLINCAINPLTAIHNCRNGELLKNPALQAQLRLVVAELADVATAVGYRHLAHNLYDLVEDVIRLTKDNYASMQQDVHHGRATEIAYINGYLCQQARQHGVATPMNQGLVAAVQQLEQTYKSSS